MEAKKFILGLDLGTNSIGWAVVKCDDNKKPTGLIDLNSRIFQEMVEADTRESKNKRRREKRGARRLISRYKERRANLTRLLIENGMLPESMKSIENWEKEFNRLGEPFFLRAKGLNGPLTPHEFGRVLMHLLRRRGYRSNRGAKYIELRKHPEVVKLSKPEEQDDDVVDGEDKEKVDERKKVLRGIDQLKEEMKKNDSKALGQFIYKTSCEKNHEPRRITKLTIDDITLYANRKMYEDEFNAIWDRQKDYLGLTDALKAQVYEAIFFQRPMKIQKNLVGKCSFELTRKRAAKGLLEAQEFRMLQEVNDLEIEEPGASQPMPLSPKQRSKIINALNNSDNLDEKGRLNWPDVKKAADLNNSAKFNLQETSKDGLSGNRTDKDLSRVITDHWSRMCIQEKKALITDLLTIHDKKALFNRLIHQYNRKDNPWNFTSKEAYDLATLELEPGYVKHCLKVINKLLPYMREGMNYHDACQEAGYLRKDQRKIVQKTRLDAPPYVANPIVQKTLFETRRVVNGILKTYGTPQVIRLELAREIKASKKHRREIQKQQEENRKLNRKAEKELLSFANEHPEYGISRVSGKDIEKYKLWLELGGAHECPYSGRPISLSMLFSNETEVDHIFPLSRSHDNSYLNKVLCLASENKEKGNKTPFERWGGTNKFNNILNRLEKLEKQGIFDSRKLRKIKETRFDGDSFISAQLNDTRYISVTVKNYLEQLGVPVQISTGQSTATIRRFLGLNSILPRKPEKTVGPEENGAEGDNEEGRRTKSENKRDDHRHHAIDAFVTALTDKRLFDEITRRYQYFERVGKWPQKRLENIWVWKGMRNDVKDALMKSVVSFAVNRKVTGSLHKEMPFGAAHYLDEIEVKRLKEEIIMADPILPDAESWIFEESERELVRSWWETNKKAGKKERKPLPLKNNGTSLERVKIAHRCYVKRISVAEALKYVGNNPGRKRWIVDKGVRNVLAEWLKVPGNDPKKTEENPPLMPNKKNPDKPNPVKTVRVATTFSKTSIQSIGRTETQFFELGSNHHVAIFKNKKTSERKGRVVSMFEAASWIRNSPIIKTQYPEFNPDEWEFEMFLCANDMVLWDIEDAEWQKAGHQSLGLPLYRVQKFSQSDNSIRIIFRHHSVTATRDKDNWGVLRRSPNTLRCKKVIMDVLGKYRIEK